MTITYRQTKGTALTYGEVDENFRDLYEDTTIDRVIKNGNTTTRTVTFGTVKATTANATTVNATNGNFTNLSATGTVDIGAISGADITNAGTVSGTTATFTTVNATNANTANLRVRTSQTIATSTTTGTVGQIEWDADYIYVCVATNTWKRAQLLTW